MGAKQSALKKQVAALQAEARRRSAKHQEELDVASKEKRLLQVKIAELQATVVQAQQEAEKTKVEAREREERMKALKWELVRQLKLTGSPSTSPTGRASLSPSSSARIALNWRLNEDVALRQSVVSPKKESSNAATSDNTSAPTATTPSVLLAPRRSLIKRAESSATRSPTPNQATDADAKEANTPSETTVKSAETPDSKPNSDDLLSSEVKHNAPSPARTSPRESKSESTNDDDLSPPSDSRDDDEGETPPRKLHAESKDSEDDSPETNDILNFSDSDG